MTALGHEELVDRGFAAFGRCVMGLVLIMFDLLVRFSFDFTRFLCDGPPNLNLSQPFFRAAEACRLQSIGFTKKNYLL